ncbi:MAG: hypothetical protein ACE5Z5_01175 [Candidatus Bathyarchaeia archaeon]
MEISLLKDLHEKALHATALIERNPQEWLSQLPEARLTLAIHDAKNALQP